MNGSPGPWGVEQTDEMNWIGPLRADGKVERVICALPRVDLKAEFLRRSDADAKLIAQAPALRDALVLGAGLASFAAAMDFSGGRNTQRFLEELSCRLEKFQAVAQAALVNVWRE